MNKFKVGDRVKIVEESIGGSATRKYNVGKIGSIVEVDNNDHYKVDGDFIDSSGREHSKGRLFLLRELELVKESKTPKPIKVNFLLKYELDEDPIEEFETRTAVMKRIRELTKDTSLKRDSIVVYEVKKKVNITLEDSVKIKGL